ncbi:hypothetical protein A0H81_02884 [Grifola frondosa]|uniref:Uncharacterized protein n=1 Tax=Grifola frondosa TaxID=5627 RepID=A0A1C7MNA5_GRIFR|nr:hypothetical protein A0H81_02884 [Grifola frondosa]
MQRGLPYLDDVQASPTCSSSAPTRSRSRKTLKQPRCGALEYVQYTITHLLVAVYATPRAMPGSASTPATPSIKILPGAQGRLTTPPRIDTRCGACEDNPPRGE